jgi:cell division protein FtsQ
MSLENEDPDGDELPPQGKLRFGGRRFDGPKKTRWRKTRATFRVLLALAVLGGLAACATLLITFLSSDAHFRIAGASNIEATGLTEVSRAELLTVFGEDIGRNIFFVPLGERRRQLEEIPWVEKATVMRLLPDHIQVSIVERQPVAFVRQGTQIGLVDANGILLTMPAAMMAQRHYSFPVLTGINASDSPAQRKARMAVYQQMLAELDANNQHYSEQISEIDLSDPADVRALMPEQDGDILAHFGQEQFLDRYKGYKAGINEWHRQYPKLAAVDLRYNPHVVLQMATNDATPGAVGDQTAEQGQNAGNKPKEHTSGAKAPADSGSSDARDSAGAKAPAYQPPAYQTRTTAKVKPGTAGAKPAGKGTAKVKAPTAKKTSTKTKTAAKTVKVKATGKKRAEASQTALDGSKRKTAPTTRPASTAEQGQ